MQVIKAFKFRLTPNAEQRELLADLCRSADYAWNWTLGTCQREYAAAVEAAKEDDAFELVPDKTPAGKPRLEDDGSPKMRKRWLAKPPKVDKGRLYRLFVDHHDLSQKVKAAARAEEAVVAEHPYPFLVRAHSHIYSYPIEHVVKAYKSWWSGSTKRPRFKKRGSKDSFSVQLRGEPKGTKVDKGAMSELKSSIRAVHEAIRDARKEKDEAALERLASEKKKIQALVDQLVTDIRSRADQAEINKTFLTDRQIKVPGVGWIRCRRNPRERVGTSIPRSVTVSRVADHWYASIPCIVEIPDPQPRPEAPVVGIDLGVNALVTLSNGSRIAPGLHLEKKLRQLKKLQRQLSRKQGPGPGKKPSKRWERQKKRIGRLHETIAQSRLDFLHKLSRQLVAGARVVVVEGFDVQKLLGQVDRRARRRAISDAAWGELRRQLEYKGLWHGTETLVRGEYEKTDQPCHECGTINKMPDDTSVYRCQNVECRLHEQPTTRQLNTAKLLERFGRGDMPPEPKNDFGGDTGTGGQPGTHARGLDGSALSLDEGSNQPGQTARALAQADRNANGSASRPAGASPAGAAGFLPPIERTPTSAPKVMRKRRGKRKRAS